MVTYALLRQGRPKGYGTLNFDMPDARKPHLPNVVSGSKPEVSDGHENVGFRGKSRLRFRVAGCLLVAEGVEEVLCSARVAVIPFL